MGVLLAQLSSNEVGMKKTLRKHSMQIYKRTFVMNQSLQNVWFSYIICYIYACLCCNVIN